MASMISSLAVHGGVGRSACGPVLNKSNTDDGAAELTRAGVIPVLLRVINGFQDYDDEAGEHQHLYAMYTVFNMSKFDFSRQALAADHRVLVAMEKMMSHRREIVRLMANFCTCLIAGRDEAGVGAELIRNSPEIVQETVDLLDDVLDRPGQSVREAVWDPDEIVIVLLSLSISDANKPLLVPAIPILIRCLRSDSSPQLVEDATTTLLQLSFEPSTQQILTESRVEIENSLDDCDKTPTAEKSAKTLLSRLIPPEQKKAELVELETRLAEMSVQSGSGSAAPKQVMISYNWAHQPVIKVIHKFLVSKGIKVWIDFEQMTGNIADKMAEAVETSDAVIMCVSSKYKESANCRQEAEYAVECRKPLVVCMMEEGYKANGWLGLLLGRKLWVNCMDGNSPDLEGIIKELAALGIQ